MTAVEWLEEKFNQYDLTTGKAYFRKLLHEAKQMEKQREEQRLRDAIMYALDEDGHTGDWKIKFATDYINNLKQTK